MSLNILWFLLIAVLYAGFFFLEGFDFGVGMLLPILGKNDRERRIILRTIGPHWDGNEVWLLTAAGATFAAFPAWYAGLFSGFYILFLLLLLSLVLRGVAFEFRSKLDGKTWQAIWDSAIFLGSLLPAFLLGVLFSNLVSGVPLDAHGSIVGAPFFFFNLQGLLGGLSLVLLFCLHGANFLRLKLGAPLDFRATFAAQLLFPLALIFVAVQQQSVSFFSNGVFQNNFIPIFIMVSVILFLLIVGYCILRRWTGWAFLFGGLSIVFSTFANFAILFPNVLISSQQPQYNLTIQNAASSPYTLTVMTIVTLVFLPIVLGYQIWSYRIFRERIQADSNSLIY